MDVLKPPKSLPPQSNMCYPKCAYDIESATPPVCWTRGRRLRGRIEGDTPPRVVESWSGVEALIIDIIRNSSGRPAKQVSVSSKTVQHARDTRARIIQQQHRVTPAYL
jgi:hypothetical protein